MDLTLLRQTPLAVRIHLVTVIPAFAIGTWLLFVSRKGSQWHRRLGFVYLALMTSTAIATIFVRELNPGHWTWVHLFVPLTFWGVFKAIWRIRQRDIQGHKNAMIGLYFGGLILAGGIALGPGRLLHRVFFK